MKKVDFMSAIEPVEIQRLVDGELSFEQTQWLLQRAEAQPESWRLIASSFVENQIWQSEFFDGDSSELAVAEKKRFSRATSFGIEASRWISLAALVMLSATIGAVVARYTVSPTGATSNSLVVNDGSHGESISEENLGEYESPQTLVRNDGNDDGFNKVPLYQFEVEDALGNSVVDSQVPLYSGRHNGIENWLKDLERSDHAIPAPRSGYRMDRNIRYFRGRMNDGRDLIIPVRNYRYAPGQ